MPREVKAGIASAAITIALSVGGALIASSWRLSATETRTTRNESDIAELRHRVDSKLDTLMDKLDALDRRFTSHDAAQQALIDAEAKR